MGVAPTERDLSVEVFGTTWQAPVFMAPIGVIEVCAQGGHGDLAAARAAARTVCRSSPEHSRPVAVLGVSR
ncbi:lactate 2-monooxygenase [Mycobacterium xenopi]|nr:lactate 2-monooxygenase [Mycobacterium xenopi]